MSGGDWVLEKDSVFDNQFHLHPEGDLVEHEIIGTDCVCKPKSDMDSCECGLNHVLVTHSSLDGREVGRTIEIAVNLTRVARVSAGVTAALAGFLVWRRFR